MKPMGASFPYLSISLTQLSDLRGLRHMVTLTAVRESFWNEETEAREAE